MKNNKLIICIIVIILIILGIYIITSKNNKEKIKGTEIINENIENGENIVLETNKNITITQGGIYKITGTSTNSNITVDTEEEVTLVLDNVELTNETGPAITIENSKNTTLTLLNTNKLSGGKKEDYNAVIYSKDDLTINGTGLLEITTDFENGIKVNNDLTIETDITVNSKTNGIIGKDNITIKSGNINITSGGDAIKSNNNEDETKGNITIENANITIN